MKRLFFYIMALAIVVSCESNFSLTDKEPGDDRRMITEVISGGHGASTKATIADADASFAWTEGDNIAVHVSSGTSHQYVFTSDEGASGATIPDPLVPAIASFTVVYPEGYSRDAFAVYPSTIVSADAANYGQSGSPLDVTLPGSYTLAQVSGTTTPCPMIAANTAGQGWTFFQLCGLLRLTVSGIHPNTKRLEIDFNGKKVWGVFSIASPVSPGTSVIATSDITTSDDEDLDIITITKNGTDVTLNNNAWMDLLVLNIPLPTGGPYSNITVTSYDALSGGSVLFTTTTTLPMSYTVDREHGTKRFACFPVFSVSDSQRVIFSPGNLQATYTAGSPGSWTWGFAEHQYDFIGNNAGNTTIQNNAGTNASLSGNGTVDLFGWSSDKTYYGIAKSSTAADYEGDFIDWGNNIIGTYPADYWRTLSNSEWHYLVGKDGTHRAGTSSSYAWGTKATINTDGTSVLGFIIFPDYFPKPTAADNVGTDIQWGTGINSTGTSGWTTTCTVAGWNYLESAGCVFLPATGYFWGTSYRPGTNHSSNNTYYRSSTSAKTMRFNDSGYDPVNGSNNSYRGAVRLVHSEGFRSTSKEGYSSVSF